MLAPKEDNKAKEDAPNEEEDWGEEEEDEEMDVATDLPAMPQPTHPKKRVNTRMTSFSRLFDRGDKGELNQDEQDARDLFNSDGTPNTDRAIQHIQEKKRTKRMCFLFGLTTLVFAVGFLVTILMLTDTINTSGAQTQASVERSVVTTVDIDPNTGNPRLSDKNTGKELTTRSEGDIIPTTERVTQSGRKLDCMTIEDLAIVMNDVSHRTPASLIIKDEDDSEKEIIPIDGHMKDMDTYLDFATFRVLLDDDSCETARDKGDNTPNDEDMFTRNLLRHPMQARAAAAPLESTQVLTRHRATLKHVRDTLRIGRVLDGGTGDEVPVSHGGVVSVPSSVPAVITGVRHVQVKLTNSNWLQIAEFQVFDSTGSNVALCDNCVMTQSTTGGNNLLVAERAGDEDFSTYSSTQPTQGAWWKVDLGQSVDVASIKLFPRQDYGKQHTVASSVISLNDEYANILGVYNIGARNAIGTVDIFQSIDNILQLEILASDFEGGLDFDCSNDSSVCVSSLECDGARCKGGLFYDCSGNSNACGSGLVCFVGLCYGDLGYECSDHTNCAVLDGGPLRCLDGQCQGGLNFNCSNDSSVCASSSSLECDGSLCKGGLSYDCSGNSDACGSGLVCFDGSCQTSPTNSPSKVPTHSPTTAPSDSPTITGGLDFDCSNDSSVCVSSLECDGARCKGGLSYDCSGNSNACGSGLVCVDDLCYGDLGYECSDHTNCAVLDGGQLRCLDGQCQGGLNFNCSNDSSVCASSSSLECDGSLCKGGLSYDCSENNPEWLLFSDSEQSSINVCGSGLVCFDETRSCQTSPTNSPSKVPTHSPTTAPSDSPTKTPSASPTPLPTPPPATWTPPPPPTNPPKPPPPSQ